jgi:GH35 family endo-1,4-beta-xylanase
MTDCRGNLKMRELRMPSQQCLRSGLAAIAFALPALFGGCAAPGPGGVIAETPTTAAVPTKVPTEAPPATLMPSTATARPTEAPTRTAVPPTATPKPTEMPTPVLALEKQPATIAAVTEFANAMKAAGIATTAEQVLQEGLTTKEITGIGGIKYQVASTKDGYPLMMGIEGGVWEAIPLRLVADGAQLKVGTLIADKHSGATTTVQNYITKEFNEAYITIDGSETERTPGNFTFRAGDTDVQLAKKHNMSITGGHLIYGASDFTWGFAKDKKGASKEELVQLIRNHIKGVMEHFKGQIDVWTVVNESGMAVWQSDSDPYANLIGEDEYIDIAFETARSTDPNAVLIYNQGLNETRGSDRYRMTLDIVNRLKDRKLIDGVGLQMHLNQNKWNPPSKAELIATFKSYGVPVYITELDVSMEFFNGTSEEKEAKQAQIYKDTFEASIESGYVKQ